MQRLSTCAAIFALAIPLVPALADEMGAARPNHEGPSLSTPAAKVKFAATGVKAGGLELKAGPAYGNLATGKHGTFILMPAGFVSDAHVHTEDYYAVVIKGVGANAPPGQKGVPLPAGSYWFQRGEEPHVTRCLSRTDCLFFVSQPGKFDYRPAPDQPTANSMNDDAAK